MLKTIKTVAVVTCIVTLTGCGNLNHTQKNTLGGAVIGTALGAGIGAVSGHAGTGAAIGAAAGAVGGALMSD